MRRLTWLVGPPGAGKTTFAGAQRAAGVRVVEFTDMLGPLVEPAGISRGLLAANGALVALVRSIELHPDNLALAPLLVVVGVAPEAALFAGDAAFEEVWMLLPERERWREQLRRRPGEGPRPQYDDYAYAEQLYARCERWLDEGRAIRRLTAEYQSKLLGLAPVQERLRG
jgi:hypothetical protein